VEYGLVEARGIEAFLADWENLQKQLGN